MKFKKIFFVDVNKDVFNQNLFAFCIIQWKFTLRQLSSWRRSLYKANDLPMFRWMENCTKNGLDEWKWCNARIVESIKRKKQWKWTNQRKKKKDEKSNPIKTCRMKDSEIGAIDYVKVSSFIPIFLSNLIFFWLCFVWNNVSIE